MTFLSTVFLSGFALLGLPVLIHLLARRRKKVVPWGAMQFLMGQPPKFRRRVIRLNELLLLFLRTLAMASLVLIFLRPQMPVPDHATYSDTILIVDTSLSSSRADASGQTVFSKEIIALSKTIGALNDQDEARVLVASAVPFWLNQSSLPMQHENRAALQKLVKELQPAAGGSDLPAAIVEALQAAVPKGRSFRRMIIFTDATERPWNANDTGRWHSIQAAVRDAEVPTRIEVAPVPGLASGEIVENVSVDELETERETIVTGEPLVLTATIRNRGAARTVPDEVMWKLDSRVVGRTTVSPLEPGSANTVEFSLICEEPGFHVVSCSLVSKDGIVLDNDASVVVQALEKIPVLVVDGSRTAGSPGMNESGFLVAALDAIPGPERTPAFTVQVIAPEQLARTNPEPFFCIVLANVASVNPEDTERLAGYVARGGGLWIALGDRTDLNAFNSVFSSTGAGLIPCKIGPAEAATDKAGWRILPPHQMHPATALLADTKRLDLDKARVYRQFAIAEPIPQRLSVLLKLESQAPLVVENAFGRGRIFLQTAPLGRQWSNLPLMNAYVPMVREFFWYLAAGKLHRHNIAAGETISCSVGETVSEVSMRTPDGGPIRLPVESGITRYSGTFLPGIYRFEGENTAEPFVVQREAEESNLACLTETTREELVKAGLHFSDPRTVETNTGIVGQERSLVSAVIFALLALLIMELSAALFLARYRDIRRPAAELIPRMSS